jgi:RHS repeat-associated protein
MVSHNCINAVINIIDPLSITANGSTFSYVQDHLGSVRRLTDATGAVTSSYNYSPYGSISSPTTSPANTANPFGFTGREQDETGLVYMRARYYDPSIERFISDDPLGDAQRYVGGNPLSFTDPLGLVRLDNGQLVPENNRERADLWEGGGTYPDIDTLLLFTPSRPIRSVGCAVEAGLSRLTLSRGATIGSEVLINGIKYRYSAHIVNQALKRGVSQKWIEKTIQYGQKYYDPLNNSYNYVLRATSPNGLLIVPISSTGVINTVIYQSRGKIPSRYVPQ